MMNFTSNLYKTEWLELVFQNRNKTYGAYELRLHNNETTIKALVIASVLFTSLIISPLVYDQFFNGDVIEMDDHQTIVTLIPPPPQKVIPVEPAALSAPRTPVEHQATIANQPLRVVSNEHVTSEPPTQIELNQAVISSVTSKGEQGSGLNTIDIPAGGGGTGIAETPVIDNTVYNISTSIQAYPEFPGGQAAFAKYLSRNLRFPEMAAEAGIFGKVTISFIIEKNGELSNIKILKGIGAGCDEEAVRVLSKSPKWKAGVQNDQNVRVMYTIPINFQSPE
ncbi:MAG: hypothetical protein JWN56_2889 [Sphingobacteriales bacterium]|nr:hypothetical protein [Sphingobacteriales bacterium]